MRSIVRSFLAALGIVLSLSAFADVRYNVVDLGEIPGYSFYFPFRITNRTQVLGTAWDSSFFHETAFVWQPQSGFETLQPAAGLPYAFIGGISPTGKIVGQSTAFNGVGQQATVWDSAHNPSLLGPTPAYSSDARDIKADGTIIGQFDFLPALWKPDGTLTYLSIPGDFPYGGAYRFNQSGQIIGFKYTESFGVLAMFWDKNLNPTVIEGPGPLNSTNAYDISGNGRVVGWVRDDGSTFEHHAYVWSAAAGMTVLPSLGGSPDFTYAAGINNRGQIVGASIPRFDFFTSAVLWENGQIINLNSLIDQSTNWFLSTADGINDKGQIVGFGVHNVNGDIQFRAYLLDPIE
jgi:probable HAF family extracellular repeat protein